MRASITARILWKCNDVVVK